MIDVKNTLLFIFCSLFCFTILAAQQNENTENTDQNKVTTATTNNKTQQTQKKQNKVASNPPTTLPKKIAIQAPIAQQSLYKKDLTHYLNSQEVNRLLIGSDEIITLVKKDMTGNPKGVVILLPSWQQVATAPQAINYLRNQLPQQGWTTITIQPPSKPKHYPSTKLNQLERVEENQKALTDYKQKLAAIMEKVMGKAANYPGIFIVIAEGSNAALLIDLYAENKIIQPAALVTLSGHLLTVEDNQHFAQTLAKLSLPILDLYLIKGNEQSIFYAPLRLAESKRQLKVYYQQTQLQNFTSGYYPEAVLLKTINGWLKRIGY
jgi:L,D-peptidoglycan transpeptidase YkuD (ErfK/YbiS/YcfS/YnhG family)